MPRRQNVPWNDGLIENLEIKIMRPTWIEAEEEQTNGKGGR